MYNLFLTWTYAVQSGLPQFFRDTDGNFKVRYAETFTKTFDDLNTFLDELEKKKKNQIQGKSPPKRKGDKKIAPNRISKKSQLESIYLDTRPAI